MRLSEVRLQRDRLTKARLRILQPFLPGDGDSQVIVGLDVTRVGLDRLPQGGFRFVKLSRLREQVPKIAEHLGIVGSQSIRFAATRECIGRLPGARNKCHNMFKCGSWQSQVCQQLSCRRARLGGSSRWLPRRIKRPCAAFFITILPMRAFRLANSACQRQARLTAPTAVFSGAGFSVTSMYMASAASAASCDRGTSMSRPTVSNGACVSFHSTLSFSIQTSASRRLPLVVIVSASWHLPPGTCRATTQNQIRRQLSGNDGRLQWKAEVL